MKLKHSKLKNTGIIFELLVRQVTTDTLENKNSKALDIIKKNFNGTELAKEYKIYKTISKARGLNEAKANILINSIIESQRKLNQEKLKKEKYNLVSEIKNSYDLDNFFKAKIDNYKVYASAYLLFESDNSKDIINPNSVSDFKYTLFEHITTKNDEAKDFIKEELHKADPGMRHLIYQKLVEKFNKKYEDDLNEKQKGLLKEYINNITSTNNLRDYINKEFKEVKTSLLQLNEGIGDPVRQIKVKQVADIITEIPSNKVVNEDHVINLFNYYQLLDEIIDAKK